MTESMHTVPESETEISKKMTIGRKIAVGVVGLGAVGAFTYALLRNSGEGAGDVVEVSAGLVNKLMDRT